jgi:hypothetical protein
VAEAQVELGQMPGLERGVAPTRANTCTLLAGTVADGGCMHKICPRCAAFARFMGAIELLSGAHAPMN